MEPIVRGFLMVGMVDLVKKEKGEAGLKELEEVFGSPLKFNILHDYQYSRAAKLRDAVMKVLYGLVDDKNYQKMGEQVWCLINQSSFGKTLLKLFGTNFKELSQMAPRFFEILAPGGEYQYIDLGPRAYKIRHTNDLSPPSFYAGINKGVATQFGIKPTIETQKIDSKSFEVTVRW